MNTKDTITEMLSNSNFMEIHNEEGNRIAEELKFDGPTKAAFLYGFFIGGHYALHGAILMEKAREDSLSEEGCENINNHYN